MNYLGDYIEDDSVYFCWNTNDADGASITRSTDGTISVYKDDDDTQSVAGITDTEDFDGLTGVHNCKIDLSSDAFYATGHDYSVVLSGAVIDGQTVNACLAIFSIENRFMRGTDGANTVIPDVAGTAAGLHATTDGKIDTVDGVVDTIQEKTINLPAAPASTGDVTTAHATTDALIDTVDGVVDSIETKVDTIDGVVDGIKITTDKLDDTLEDDAGTYRFTENALEEAPTAEMDPTELAAAMKAITGITEGGTWTWEKIMKITTAWIAGNWRVKASDTTVQELLDAEDGETVILEQALTRSPAGGANYRAITIKI